MTFLFLLLISSPVETCFSPDEPCDQKVIQKVQAAKKSLDVAIFDINLEGLVSSLIDQSKKIPVRIVLDKRQAKGSHSLSHRLIEAMSSHAMLKVRYGHQRGIMHNKFVIVDSSLVETGSFNFTWHASHANAENQVYLRDPKVIQVFQQDFEKIWSSAR